MTVACASPPVAVTPVGAPGVVVPSVTALLAAVAPEVELALVAVTTHVYMPPGDNEGTTMGEDVPLALPAVPPLLDVHVAVKEVTGNPVTAAPGVNATEMLDVDALEAAPIVGAEGAPDELVGVAVTTELKVDEPAPLSAFTTAL